MKSAKFVSALIGLAGLLFFISSCKKQKDDVPTVTKEQLIGKWDMTVQANNYSEVWKAKLNAGGAMEVDVPPYNGIADYIFLWELNGNNFAAYIAANGIPNYMELQAPVDPATLSMAGLIKVNDPASPQTGAFAMDKQ